MRTDPFTGWIGSVDRLSKNLGTGRISPLQWQEAMGKLFGEAPLERLLHEINLPRLAGQMATMDLGVKGEIFCDIPIGHLPSQDQRQGYEPSNVLITKLAHVRQGRSIPPHGHSSMVSAFLCVSGEFHVRLFDRLEDRGEEMVIRQTLDEPHARTGSWSSVSDYRNNIHWLTARSDDCYLLCTKLIRLEADKPFRSRIYLDVRAAEAIGPATFRTPKIALEEATKKY